MLLLSVLLLLLIIPATQPKCEWWKWGLTARWYKVTDEPSWRWGIQKEKTENKGEVSREVLGSSWVPVSVPIFSWLWEGSEPRALLVFNCKTAATWGLPWSYGAEGPCPHQLPPLQGPPALTLHLNPSPSPSLLGIRKVYLWNLPELSLKGFPHTNDFLSPAVSETCPVHQQTGRGLWSKDRNAYLSEVCHLHMFLPDILYFYK